MIYFWKKIKKSELKQGSSREKIKTEAAVRLLNSVKENSYAAMK
jgi:hypothetical protein